MHYDKTLKNEGIAGRRTGFWHFNFLKDRNVLYQPYVSMDVMIFRYVQSR